MPIKAIIFDAINSIEFLGTPETKKFRGILGCSEKEFSDMTAFPEY
jgi:hypothetical protein